MQLTFFSRAGWQDWDVAAEPAIPDRMPQLVDDDLIFEDAGVPRPSVAANRWLRFPGKSSCCRAQCCSAPGMPKPPASFSAQSM
jgi:hypothetical protein